MIDTDKYETMTQHDLVEIINGLKSSNFQLEKEVKRLREMYKDANRYLDLMVERFGIEALVEMVGEEE